MTVARRLTRHLVVAAFAILLLPSVGAGHHPGSHATRASDGAVQLDVAAVVADACTTIASVTRGAPSGVTPPPGSTPVLVRLQRDDSQPCAVVVSVARSTTVLNIGPGVRHIHLYVVGMDGQLVSSERVPVH